MNYYGQRDNLRYNNKRAISLHVECHKKVYDDIKQYMNKREILKIENVAKTLDRSYQLNRVSLLSEKNGEHWDNKFVMIQFKQGYGERDFKRKRIRLKIGG